MQLGPTTALSAAALVLASACFIDFPEIQDEERVCNAGDHVFCRCPGGNPGTRECRDDGASFSECVIAPGTPCDAAPPGDDPPAPPAGPPGPSTGSGSSGKGAGGGASNEGGAGGGPADDCGGVDYFGQCQGELLAWCDGGELVESDCAAQGKICALYDDVVGYDCVEPPDPCGGVTFEGECDGELLRYCSSGELVEIDCAAEGQSCAFVAASGYYDCTAPS